ncbi:PilC/PilY family type IV pilus protein [Pseudoduganella ginsengisoli]|nr:PilC/PilY family type IV pilus protein [Pseudoduganella ginsengisoli]
MEHVSLPPSCRPPRASRVAATLALALVALQAPQSVHADDIDIFTGASAGNSINPRILIVLDNTSNWARQSQQWPGGLQQGQSEANAIKTVISSLGSNVNIGLMEFVTGGNANQNGGFIRSAIRPMTTANKTSFSANLTTIYNNINSPDEKRNSHTPYGNLMYDTYNYFAGANAYSPSAVIASIADATGYTTPYSTFAAPLTANDTCGKNFVIFIGNPNSSGPASDDSANTAALAALGGTTSQLSLPNFTQGNVTQSTNVGTTSQCYASSTAAAAELTSFSAQCSTYTEGCVIGSATAAAGPIACPSGQLSYTVNRSVYTPASTTTTAGTPVTGTPTVNTGSTTNYYGSSSAVDANTDHGSMTCPATSTVTSGGNTAVTTYSCSYSVGAAIGSATPTTSSHVSTQTGNTGGAGCYAVSGGTNVGTGAGQWNPATSTDYGGLVCPANNSCTYSGVMTSNSSGCTGSGNRTVQITQTATPLRQFTINQTVTPTTTNSTTTTTPASTTTTALGYTSQCYAAAPTSSTGDYASQCTGTNISCTYGNAPTSTTLGACPAGTSVYSVLGTNTTLTNVATGTSSLDTHPFNADEWARFMHDKGVPVSGTTVRPSVTTYTIDVYNKQPNATHTSLLMSMAKAGGGKYFSATNEQAIVDALKQILVEILAVNTSFASTSLPVNATNRSQNENQVYIGMFRPDPDAKPRWFGNLKRYQLVANGSSVDLGDVNGTLAVNTLTGFVTPCATSYWTTDSGSYWGGMGLNPDPAGGCATTSYDAYSDAPDGPQVEKGAVAEMLRKGNQSSSGTSPTWAVNRNVYTVSNGSLAAFSTASSSLSDSLVRFIKGEDVNVEKGGAGTTRPSIHGDVIHSRPLPVNYGTSGVTVFYGANDGMFRAVDASSGVERWALVAPEFYSRLQRLKDNSPQVSYPNLASNTVPVPAAKDYFFDGSTGIYQNADNSKVWVLPTMRRGGRMIYALDVSTVSTPSLKWKVGCPNLSDDTGCTAGMSQIGQTWSTPSVAFIKGYSLTNPVVVVGGGYDGCEDADTASPSCASTKGGVIYVLDANTGSVVSSFTTTRAVASDISMVDIDNDGMPDYAYAADTGGNIYRVDFISIASGVASATALGSSSWTMRKVAYTNGGGRKFLFAPALLAVQDKVYVAIGTGDREHPLQSQYPYANVVNRFYVYKDDLKVTSGSKNLDSDLVDYTSSTTCDTAQVLPNSALNGWFMNLNQFGQGEQVVTSALIVSGMVTFSTNRPVDAAVASCSTSLGKAEGYWVNLFNASGGINSASTCNGTRASEFVGGGLPPSPVLATGVNVNGRAVSVVIGAVQRDGGASVAISPQKVRPVITSKRKRVYQSTSGQ